MRTVPSRNNLALLVALDDQLSILSAEISHRHGSPLADGIIYKTAKQYEAELMTQDADLEKLTRRDLYHASEKEVAGRPSYFLE